MNINLIMVSLYSSALLLMGFLQKQITVELNYDFIGIHNLSRYQFDFHTIIDQINNYLLCQQFLSEIQKVFALLPNYGVLSNLSFVFKGSKMFDTISHIIIYILHFIKFN